MSGVVPDDEVAQPTGHEMTPPVAPVNGDADDDYRPTTTTISPNKKAKTFQDASSAGGVLRGSDKKANKARKYKEQVDWARQQNMESVEFSGDCTEVISIAGVALSKWTSKMLPAFCRENGIIIPEKKKARTDCIRFILNKGNGREMPEEIPEEIPRKGAGRNRRSAKKKAAGTRPRNASKDGTLLRVVLVITHPEVRGLYIGTNNDLERVDLDRGYGKSERWEQLLELYKCLSRPELDVIDIDLERYGYTVDEPADFDEDLTADDLKEVVRFMSYWYGKARSSNNTYGHHLDFELFVNGRGWLFFYHHVFKELGATDVMNVSYAALPENVFVISGNNSPSETITMTSIHPQNATGDDASMSSMNKSLLKTRTEAAIAILDKNVALADWTKMQLEKLKYEVRRCQQKSFETLIDNIFHMDEELVQLRIKIKENYSEDKDIYDSLKRHKYHVKHKLIRAHASLLELKTVLKIVDKPVVDSDSD